MNYDDMRMTQPPLRPSVTQVNTNRVMKQRQMQQNYTNSQQYSPFGSKLIKFTTF